MLSPWMLPMAGLAWLAGTALQLQRAALWPPIGAWALLGAGLACLFGGLILGRSGAGAAGGGAAAWQRAGCLLLAIAGGAGLGYAQTELRAHERLRDRLAAALERVDLLVTGVVADLPTRRSDGVRLRLQVESARRLADGVAMRVPDLVSLGWYVDARPVAGDAEPAFDPRAVRAGERWRLAVRLSAPHGLFNPGGFDYELWLFEQGVGASGSVRQRSGPPPRLLDAQAGYPLQRMRQAVRDAIHARLGDDSRAAGVVAALCVGDQAGIAREDWELFRTTGIAHLVAISGVHLTMLAWLAAAIVRRLWPCHAGLALRLPAPHAARLAGVLVAFGYAMLAGWGVPAQRTVLMIGVAAFTPLAGRRWPWPLTLGAAAWLVVLLDPWALLQPGFWLSFVAVGLLMLQGDEPADLLHAAPSNSSSAWGDAGWSPGARSVSPAAGPDADAEAARTSPRGWRGVFRAALRVGAAGVRTQAVATVGLAPLSLLFFNQLALVGFLANLLAIPLITLVVTPLVLLGVVLHPLWDLAAWLIELQGVWLTALAGVPLASWQPPAAPVWAQAAALLGALLLLLPAPWALRLTGLPLVLPLLWPAMPQPAEGEFELLGADVGQGQAVLVRTRTHSLLYDAGGQYSRDSDAGERVLVPLLRRLGIGPLDLLMLSHRDTDHVGGARAVLAGVGARAVSSSLEADHPLRASRAHTPCLAGQHWRWDGVDFEVLHPTARDYERRDAGHLRPNGVSCVLRVAGARRQALLPGDVEQPQELDLVARSAPRLRADVLLVAHHGSRTSSDPDFLQAVAPRWGLVQAGHHNRYGHPAPDVVDRLTTHGIEVVRTDFCGAWHWDSAYAHPWCQRDHDRRYWHAPIRGDGLELASSASNNSPP